MNTEVLDVEIHEFREKLAARKRLSTSPDDLDSKLRADRDQYQLCFMKDPSQFIETLRVSPSHGAVLFYEHLRFVIRDAFEVVYKKGTDRSSIQFLRDSKALMRHPDADAVWNLFEQQDPETLAAIVVILFKTSKKGKKVCKNKK